MKSFLTAFLLFLCTAVFSQDVKVSEVSDQYQNKLFNSIHKFQVISGRQLSISIFDVSNGSGSANLPESHESSCNLLISVAHYDEYPVPKLYNIGPFLNPEVASKTDSGLSVLLVIEHGIADRRIKTKFTITETELKILKWNNFFWRLLSWIRNALYPHLRIYCPP